MISISNIHKAYRIGALGEHLPVLAGVSFSIKPGAIVGLFGPNGCGKSTLLNVIAGLDGADAGEVIGIQRQQCSFVFQDFRRSLLPWRTVAQNIVFPLELQGVSRELQERALQEVWSLVAPSFSRAQRVTELSGGQAQTVCLMRALITKPKLLILDEPFSALDFEATLRLRDVLTGIAHQLGLSVLIVSHNIEDALYVGDSLVILSRRPTIVKEILSVDLPRPRSATDVGLPRFGELKARALEVFLA